jgi:putative nucleotidyltransferase with HDIG domain
LSASATNIRSGATTSWSLGLRQAPWAAIGIGILLALGLAAVLLLPSLARESGLEVGVPSPRDVEAPRDLSYESAVLTADRRRVAAESISPVFKELDNGMRRRQADRTRDVLRLVAFARHPEVATDDALRELAAIPELGGDAGELASRLLSLDDATLLALQRQAPAVVDSAMRLPIRPDSLGSARNSVIAYVPRDVDVATEDIIARVARRFVEPNILVDEAATEAARTAAAVAVQPVVQQISQGEMIVREGQRITPLQQETLTALGLIGRQLDARGILAVLALASGLVAAFMFTLARLQIGALRRPRRLTMIAVLIFAFSLSAALVVPGRTVMGFAFPAAALAMTLVVFAGLETAILAALVTGVMMGMAAPPRIDGLEAAVYVLLGSFAGAVTLGRVERLKSFFTAGAALLAANMLTLAAFRLPSSTLDVRGIIELAGAATANATLATGLAALGVLAAGSLFGVTTSLQMLELARPDHPLLRELQVRAPGTYQHSIVVGNLAERAATAIGADPLLVRVGAYYHDVGKIEHPYFFVENQLSGRSAHADLSPQASAKAIIDHVTLGIEIARSHGIPEPITDFILQHHGTTRVEYFYRQAVERSPKGEAGVAARDFRYPGPRPQSREAAILMVADGSEAAVRASAPGSAAEIDMIVGRIIEARLAAGQLDDCEITLRDLRRVRRSFVQTLRSMYHPRIQYPDAPSEPSPTPEPTRMDGAGHDAIDPRRILDADGNAVVDTDPEWTQPA